MPWYQHREGESYLTAGPPYPEGEVLANVAPINGKWRWEAHLPASCLVLEMDGWWGNAQTEKAGQEAAEAYLRRWRVL